MVTRAHFLEEFGRSIHRRVDLAADAALGVGQRFDHVAERHVTNHEQVDVAVGTKLLAGGRSIDERSTNALGERTEGRSNNVGQAGGFRE
jgi:hypothetical protein